MTSDKKKGMILEFLYKRRNLAGNFDLFGDGAIDLLVNDIKFNAEEMANDSLIVLYPSKRELHAAITPRGVEHYERQGTDFSYAPSDPFSKQEREETNQRLDVLLKKLERLEAGQQITYDDLSEQIDQLKVLTHVLGKKDFLATLKGKLVDLGLGSLTDAVTEKIIETFKDHPDLFLRS
jgi:hypothetical protein